MVIRLLRRVKRKEKLSRKFIALAANIPGLKKNPMAKHEFSKQQVSLVPKEEETSMGFAGTDETNQVLKDLMDQGANHEQSPGYYVDHDDQVVAEKKKREKLNQKFLALAANIPGLNKADKASILGDAITYIKQLEHNVKSLEDQKTTGQSAVLVNKSKLYADENGNLTDRDHDGISSPSRVCSGSGDNIDGSSSSGKFPPEVQVTLMSNETVIVKIHCENHKGLLVELLSEIEKLKLRVTSANVLPFTESFHDIAITAQMEDGFTMTMKDLAGEITSIFLQFNW